jgi:hypothetical protein
MIVRATRVVRAGRHLFQPFDGRTLRKQLAFENGCFPVQILEWIER